MRGFINLFAVDKQKIKQYLFAAIMPLFLLIVVPLTGDIFLPGGWRSLQTEPELDTIDAELIVRIFLVGFIPALIYQNRFYILPIVSCLSLALAILPFFVYTYGISFFINSLVLTFFIVGGIYFFPIIFVGVFVGMLVKGVYWKLRDSCSSDRLLKRN